MVLALNDHRAMLAGFKGAGYACTREPRLPTNPVQIQWHVDGEMRRYRLWSFDVTHGGGPRNKDEYRIQITNGPSKEADFDKDGSVDLLIGYSRAHDAIVAYDRRWLENWTRQGGGSPSVQVKIEDIQAGRDHGVHRLTKPTKRFGEADIVTMKPALLPAYLLNHDAVLRGTMSADEARSVTPQHGCTTIVDYCCSQGFPFDPDLIARYLAALLTKPFVILAGVSGTGKSKLAELVAEFYSSAPTIEAVPAAQSIVAETFVFTPVKRRPDPTRFALVAVRPDWTDNQSILGFVNPITERYETTQALELALRADRALRGADEKPLAPRYFMLLDEMNLARVEHYFSDWLACSESRRLTSGGSIGQQAVLLHRSTKPMDTNLMNSDGSSETLPVPESLALPTNLVVTGTVNVDETTHGFSPKVLDRAMVLEFDEVDLERLRSGGSDIDVGSYRFPDTLPRFQLATPADYAAIPPAAHEHLVALNAILEEARLHLGYRAASEIGLFMKLYSDLLPEDSTDQDSLRALDAAVLQKVLPRLSGNRTKLDAPLAMVCAYLRDLVHPEMDVHLDDFDRTADARLPRSYRRAVEMLESLRDFGYVSFFK